MAEEINNYGKRKTPNEINWEEELAKETRELSTSTRKLYKATLGLFIFTVIIAVIGQEQACNSGNEIEISRASDSAHRASDSLRLKGDSLKNRNDSIASVAQISALLKQVSISDVTAKRQLRPYIGISVSEDTIIRVGDSSHCMIKLQLQNTGRTPASNLRYFIDTVVMPGAKALAWQSTPGRTEYPEEWAFGNRAVVSHETLFPNESTYLDCAPVFTSSAMDSILNGSLGFFVFGMAAYTDIFGDSCYSNFRYVKMAGKYGDLIFAPCAGGNEWR